MHKTCKVVRIFLDYFCRYICRFAVMLFYYQRFWFFWICLYEVVSNETICFGFFLCFVILLEWYLNFLIAFKTGSLISFSLISKGFSEDVFRLGTTFTENLLKVPVAKSSGVTFLNTTSISPLVGIFFFFS